MPEPSIPTIGSEKFPLFCQARKEAHALSLAEAILDERPYPIKAMIIAGGNPTLEWPNSIRTRQALQKLEFLMLIDVVRSPDSQYADVVLPACTFLERDEHRVSTSHGKTVKKVSITCFMSMALPIGISSLKVESMNMKSAGTRNMNEMDFPPRQVRLSSILNRFLKSIQKPRINMVFQKVKWLKYGRHLGRFD